MLHPHPPCHNSPKESAFSLWVSESLKVCFSHCVSYTAIHSQVLSCQAALHHKGCAHCQSQTVLEFLILSGWTILRVNPAHPLKSLSGCLPHPVHIVADESDCLSGHLHWVPWPPHNSFRLFKQDWAWAPVERRCVHQSHIRLWPLFRPGTGDPLSWSICHPKDKAPAVAHGGELCSQGSVEEGVVVGCSEHSPMCIYYSCHK
jgi:hypothetical protein